MSDQFQVNLRILFKMRNYVRTTVSSTVFITIRTFFVKQTRRPEQKAVLNKMTGFAIFPTYTIVVIR